MDVLIGAAVMGGCYMVGWYVTAVGLARRAHEWTYICHRDCKVRYYGNDVVHTAYCKRRLQPMQVPQSVALALIWPLVCLYAAVVWGARRPVRKQVDPEWVRSEEKRLGLGD